MPSSSYSSLHKTQWYNSICQEEFEDTKGVIRSSNSKDRQHNGDCPIYIKDWYISEVFICFAFKNYDINTNVFEMNVCL